MQLGELDKPDTVQHLLSWFNSALRGRSPVYTLDQLEKTSHVSHLLAEVHEESFKVLCGGECDLQRYITLLERYLACELGKTMKRRFRLELLQKSSSAMLVGVILFVCVHCNKKEKYIKDILEESAATQTCLMRVIELMDRNIENIMEIREILEKVEELELENDSLREQLKSECDKNGELAERLDIIMADYKTLEEECDALKTDKIEVLKELNITSMSEYSQLFKNVQNENAELTRSLEKVEKTMLEITRDKINYKAKIMEDGQIISDLSEELGRIKGVCRSLRLSNSISHIDNETFDYQDYLSMSLENNVLKENKVLCNLQDPQQAESNKKNIHTEGDEIVDVESYLQLQYEYKQLSFKFDKLKQTSDGHKDTLTNYADANQRLKRYNDFLQSKMQQLREIHGDLTKTIQLQRVSCRA